jgi:hypothetical protein
MCGIVGVVRRRATRPVPDAAALVRRLDEALAAVGDGIAEGGLTDTLREMAAQVEAVDRELRGVPGVRALLGDPQSALLIGDRVDQLTAWLDRVEAELDGGLGPTLVPPSWSRWAQPWSGARGVAVSRTAWHRRGSAPSPVRPPSPPSRRLSSVALRRSTAGVLCDPPGSTAGAPSRPDLDEPAVRLVALQPTTRSSVPGRCGRWAT